MACGIGFAQTARRIIGRWLAVDYGTRRIGTALSDLQGRIASPGAVLESTGSVPGDAKLIAELAANLIASGIVIGLPLSMDGSEGTQAQHSQRLAAALRESIALPIELWDERLSSFQADELAESARVKKSKRKFARNALAAQVILQSFLDARPASER